MKKKFREILKQKKNENILRIWWRCDVGREAKESDKTKIIWEKNAKHQIMCF